MQHDFVANLMLVAYSFTINYQSSSWAIDISRVEVIKRSSRKKKEIFLELILSMIMMIIIEKTEYIVNLMQIFVEFRTLKI